MAINTTGTPLSARLAVAAAALAALLLVGSCAASSEGGPAGPAVSSPHPISTTPATTPTDPPATTSTHPPATFEITRPRQGSLVSWSELVTGLVRGLPAGMSAWLVIQPGQPTGYWPQPGPLYPDATGKGRFVSQATFGLSPNTDHGEQFILMIVQATPDADQRFKQFVAGPQSTGMPGLPDGTQVLTQISVTRS